MNDWLTIEELAKQEGITVDGARKRAQRGQYAKKKDGRRTLYRIFTEEESAAITDGKAEVSAQSAYLVAKAKKMQLDTQTAELKLNREKMLLYDSIRTDTLAAIKYAGELFRTELADFLTEEQKRKYSAAIDTVFKQTVKRFNEFRQERAKEATPAENELEKGYWEHFEKKTKEEIKAKEAEEREKAKKEAERRANMTLDEIHREKVYKFRCYADKILFMQQPTHEEAQAWQDAEMELERDWMFAQREAKTREDVEAIAQDFTRRLEKRAEVILARYYKPMS